MSGKGRREQGQGGEPGGCPAILGRHPLLNEVAFEAREEQLDRLCDANGGAFEDAELRGLVRTIIYLESIKPTTCSLEQKMLG
jgi:hypothetical protein